MEKRDLEFTSLILGGFAILFMAVFLFINPSITGNVILTGETNFTNNYTYDEDILIEANVIRLKQVNVTGSWVEDNITSFNAVKAYYDYSDKTDKVMLQDDDEYELKEDKIFDIIFENELDNGDVINFYILNDSPGTFHLCDASEFCDPDGYGSVYFNGSEGLFSITLENLEEPKKSFNVRVYQKMKVDRIYSNINLLKGLYNPSDKTNKIDNINGDEQKVGKNKLFSVLFNQDVKTNDIFSIYLDSDDDEGNLYLCDHGIECDDSVYGTVYNDGSGGWFNITVSDLTGSDILTIDSDDEYKIDYLEVTRNETLYFNETNITYSLSGEVETEDLDVSSFYLWGEFVSSESLNGGNVTYYYSIDSGENWYLVDDLSVVNSSKIRFKALLEGDGSFTPEVYSMSVGYKQDICEENWECSDYGECSIDAKKRTCVDLNSCGTIENKPGESLVCVQENYAIENVTRIATEQNKNIIINSTNDEILINTGVNLTNATFVVSERNDITSDKLRVLNDLEINVSNDVNNNLQTGQIKRYYSDEDIQGVKESSLKLHYYNETSSEWEELETYVNVEQNYIVANVTHFSVYGLFGDKKEESSSSNTGSGGKSSFVRPTNTQEEVVVVEEPVVEEQTQEETVVLNEEPEEITLVLTAQEDNGFSSFTGSTISDIASKGINNVLVIAFIVLVCVFVVYTRKKNKIIPY